MRVSPNQTAPIQDTDQQQTKEDPRVLKAASDVQKIMTPYFMPFLVKISRETHPHEFFPRRWFESAQLMGVFRGFSNHMCRESGLKKHTEEKRVYFHSMGLAFQWPAESIVAYLNDSQLDTADAYKKGMQISKNVLSEKGSRKKIHELTLIRLIDDEHYRIADDLKRILTNDTLKRTFQPRDFQIAKGW